MRRRPDRVGSATAGAPDGMVSRERIAPGDTELAVHPLFCRSFFWAPLRANSCARHLLPKNVHPGSLQDWPFSWSRSMRLTGRQETANPNQSRVNEPLPSQVPLEVNETRITELQNRIEELQRQQLRAKRPRATDPLARSRARPSVLFTTERFRWSRRPALGRSHSGGTEDARLTAFPLFRLECGALSYRMPAPGSPTSGSPLALCPQHGLSTCLKSLRY